MLPQNRGLVFQVRKSRKKGRRVAKIRRPFLIQSLHSYVLNTCLDIRQYRIFFRMDLALFPELPEGAHGRTIYVRGLDPLAAECLRERGYRPIEINTLPRGDDSDNAEYLRAKLQGLEEGSIAGDEETRKLLELEMRAAGLLDRRSVAMKVNLKGDANTIEKLFGWRSSRHTLADNSTVVSAQRLPQGTKN